MIKTYPSIEELKLDSNKSTIICDADEVIFDFMHEFLMFLKKKKLFFNWKSYALTGNIFKDNNQSLDEIEVKELINNFFLNCAYEMKLVKGAFKTLNLLSKNFNIIILSNIPFEYYELRKKALIKNNLDFPFLANSGEKGDASYKIFNILGNETWFIDDSPYQVYSVKTKEPKIKTILFIANDKLAKLITNKKKYDFYSTSWYENKKILLKQFI